MNFFDMGPLEIILVLVIALIIFGPGKIPDIARNLGRTVNALRKASFDITSQIKQELEVNEKDEQSKAEVADRIDKSEEQPNAEVAESNDEKTISPGDQ